LGWSEGHCRFSIAEFGSEIAGLPGRARRSNKPKATGQAKAEIGSGRLAAAIGPNGAFDNRQLTIDNRQLTSAIAFGDTSGAVAARDVQEEM
jgi:hypothetical protein